jgi:ABC-type antimicrobial peptide transport system permease subunit
VFLTYLRRELRRRMRQAILIALGLAVGIGLVITVTALSAGVANAQGTVLHLLYGLGTDVTVTKAPSAQAGGPRSFGFGGAIGSRTRPAAGTKIDIDNLGNVGLGTLSSSSVTAIARLQHVAAAAGGLTLTDTRITGKIPAINSGGSGGSGSDAGGAGGFRGALTPTSFSVAGVDLSQGELGPLSAGRVAAGRTFSTADANADVAMVDSDYARQQKLKVGSAITIARKKFRVVGIVRASPGAAIPDAYIPLARAQALAGMKNKMNTVYVAADSAAAIGAVSREISALMPTATVTNSSDLASEVTGSLASTASLANRLGRWLAIAVLAAAFLLAGLLTMAAVSRRVREFGTLKALGWRSRRVTSQVVGESVVIGVLGGIAGVGLGFLGAGLVSRLAPTLSASIGPITGSATPGGARAFGAPGGGPGGFQRLAAGAGHTVSVHLTAPVTLTAVATAVALAIAGGLIAGGLGGWRAARLRPAAALAKVG